MAGKGLSAYGRRNHMLTNVGSCLMQSRHGGCCENDVTNEAGLKPDDIGNLGGFFIL